MLRPNHRGRFVVFPSGAVLLAVSLALFGVLAAIGGLTGVDPVAPGAGRWAVFVSGVALLGLLDDLAGSSDRDPRGWRGHGAAVLSGRASTGAVKALGTGALALWAVAGLPGDLTTGAVDAGVLALATNLGNLLDLRPGRAEKALVLALAAVCAGCGTLAPLGLLAVFVVPVVAGSWFTLRERAMLGDTGAHIVGALIGIALVTTLSFPLACVALAALAAISVFGEFRSISSVIDRLPLVKQLDSLGRVR
jgi:UDP-GlcNAc:undecaprenyl-phosphate GlcNAc-1-phosphate transferase